MKFRPCIDIHNGKVKQIVGSSLIDEGNRAKENFSSDKGGEYFAKMYREKKLYGGHIILLNSGNSEYFNETKEQAVSALRAFPGGMQLGGGVNAQNAAEYLEAGASHVIVTSFVFKNGNIDMENLNQLVNKVGREHIVLDLSCRKKDGEYYIVTDRWQKFTNEIVNEKTLDFLADYCDEFLVHAVDVEGKNNGIEEELAEILGKYSKIPMTYAGGIRGEGDINKLDLASGGKMDFTIGSALDIFGGELSFQKIAQKYSG